jgi:predicted nucleotidyltransferase
MRTDEEILEAVQNHHNNVVENYKRREAEVLMTVLVGSQNYNIASETSDIDTVSFVLPSITEIALLHDPIATEYELDDGKCIIKDIRAALNLLKKTNPNSVEWFCSNYNIYNPNYEHLLKKFFDKKHRSEFLYCDLFQMENSCKGMAKQLKNRNMPAGKKYSHALRVRDMFVSYILGDTDNILNFRSEEIRSIAAEAKQCKDESRDEEFQQKSEEIADEISKIIEEVNNNLPNDNKLAIKQNKNKESVNYLQFSLIAKHFSLQLAKIFG